MDKIVHKIVYRQQNKILLSIKIFFEKSQILSCFSLRIFGNASENYDNYSQIVIHSYAYSGTPLRIFGNAFTHIRERPIPCAADRELSPGLPPIVPYSISL